MLDFVVLVCCCLDYDALPQHASSALARLAVSCAGQTGLTGTNGANMDLDIL